MLTTEYEQSLVETTVFLAVRHNESQERALHLAVDPLYGIEDEELRERAFLPVFRSFFVKLGLDRVIGDVMAERPLIREQVDQCIVREAARKKAESAELFVRAADNGQATYRTIVIQVCPESLVAPERFIPPIRRELLHIADMLDERFGYQRDTFPGPLSLQNLRRDRYTVLWDTYVAGRLQREGSAANGEMDRLRQAFGRVFVNAAADADGRTFRRVFDAPSLTHRTLMTWACEPSVLFDSAQPTKQDGHPTGTTQALESSGCPASEDASR